MLSDHGLETIYVCYERYFDQTNASIKGITTNVIFRLSSLL